MQYNVWKFERVEFVNRPPETSNISFFFLNIDRVGPARRFVLLLFFFFVLFFFFNLLFSIRGTIKRSTGIINAQREIVDNIHRWYARHFRKIFKIHRNYVSFCLFVGFFVSRLRVIYNSLIGKIIFH